MLPSRLLYGRQHSTEACVRKWLDLRTGVPPTEDGPSDDELRERGLLTPAPPSLARWGGIPEASIKLRTMPYLTEFDERLNRPERAVETW